jgi:hypothetical protein
MEMEDGRDEDWDEIAQQESFLAAEAVSETDWDEPDGYVVDPLSDRTVTLSH